MAQVSAMVGKLMPGGWPHVPERMTMLGIERRCRYCEEWYPLDAEFFTPDPKCRLGFTSQCRACLRPIKNANCALHRALQPKGHP